MGLPPNRILYVGDQWDEDVLGARQVGMHSKLIDRGSQGGSDTLKRLTDLEAVVAEAW
ncbi:MAG: HAD hydrolase-like protein [Limisphaerales bacterium]